MKELVISLTGWRDNKLYESSFRIEEDIYKEVKDKKDYLSKLHGYVSYKFPNHTNKMFVIWKLYRIDKYNDLSVSKLQKEIDKYFE